MGENSKEIETINNQIKDLKKKKDELKVTNKRGNNQSNILRRMSTNFFNEMRSIDKDREKFGFNPLSLPEKTDLVIKHRDWMKTRQDITHFNKEIENNGRISNEQNV